MSRICVLRLTTNPTFSLDVLDVAERPQRNVHSQSLAIIVVLHFVTVQLLVERVSFFGFLSIVSWVYMFDVYSCSWCSVRSQSCANTPRPLLPEKGKRHLNGNLSTSLLSLSLLWYRIVRNATDSFSWVSIRCRWNWNPIGTKYDARTKFCHIDTHRTNMTYERSSSVRVLSKFIRMVSSLLVSLYVWAMLHRI